MAPESKQTLVTELAGMFEGHARRQAELVACLQVLRAELLALPAGRTSRRPDAPPAPRTQDQERRSDGEPSPPPPPLSRARSTAPAIQSRRLPTPTAPMINRPARQPSVTGTHRDALVGAPGHTPTRDYNYFAELDHVLNRRQHRADS